MVKIASPDKASTPSQLLASSSKSPAWATEKNAKKFGGDLGFVQLFTQMNSMETSRQNSSSPAETGCESVVIPEDVAFAAPHEKTGVGAPTTAASAGVANAAARSHRNTRGPKKTVVKTVRFAATELAVIKGQLKGRDFSEVVRALLLGRRFQNRRTLFSSSNAGCRNLKRGKSNSSRKSVPRW
jgi:hypothetical protein